MADNLRMHSWMHDFTQEHPDVRAWQLSKFHYPGTHDSATFLSGAFNDNWKCQDMNFYAQLDCGVRYLDLRLNFESDGRWWPHHGLAHKIANVLAENGEKDENPTFTVIGQLKSFIEEHPSELIIIALSANTIIEMDDLWEIWMNDLEARLLPVPHDDRAPVPTYEAMESSGRSLMIVTKKTDDTKPSDSELVKKWSDLV